MSRKPGTQGMSLVELMIAVGLIAIVASGVMMALEGVAKRKQFEKERNMADIHFNNYVEDLRKNLSRYQISFSEDTASPASSATPTPSGTPSPSTPSTAQAKPANFAEARDQLKIAWSSSYWGEASDCRDCPGRAGYWIEPLPKSGYRGLFKVTVRLYHQTLYRPYKEIQFMAFGN